MSKKRPGTRFTTGLPFACLLILFSATSQGRVPDHLKIPVLLDRVIDGDKSSALSELETLARSYSIDGCRARVALAEHFYRDGHYRQALPYLLPPGEAESMLPGIDGHIHLLRGRIHYANRDYSDAVDESSAALKGTLSPALVPRALQLRIRSLSRLDREQDLQLSAREFLKRFPTNASADEITWFLISSLEKTGQVDEAFQLSLGLWRKDPSGYYGKRSATLCVRHESKTRTLPFSSPGENRAVLIRNLVRSGQGKRALSEIEAAMKESPSMSVQEELHFLEARAFEETGNLYRAAVKCRWIMDHQPTSRFVQEAALLRFQLARTRGYPDLAEEIAAWAASHISGTAEHEQMFYTLGLTARQSRDYKKAIGCFNQVIFKRSGSDAFLNSAWNGAWCHLALREYEKARKTLLTLLSVVPESDYTIPSKYWVARLNQIAKRNDEFLTGYRELSRTAPHTYYGYLAGRKLKSAAPEPETLEVRRTDSILPLLKPGLETDLVSSGLLNDASRVVDSVKTADHDRFLLRIWLLAAGGTPRQSIDLIHSRYERAIRGGADNPLPKFAWTLTYPRYYADHIHHYATKRGLDESFLYAVIRRESAFERNAQSPAGAVGLMQIMKRTAAGIARSMGIRKPSHSKLKQEEYNIMMGSYYLQHLFKKYHKEEPDLRLIYTLTAYNAGMGNLRSWDRAFGSRDPEIFVELIPFVETRLFIKNVLRAQWEYERIYPDLN